ncbi:uncharacterized protein GGS22DRAFT_189125 [Annulohypoxylon maeteangense]|uniref:uncharacterized protein n=1 Tax=Annulohypoxylon maeteangense TaxID=1927788 RepID=UPI002008653D|nr:uncharacterized protein GGS22DRAFT_189125 [Annulohypoxylon maeteangense]KAI0884913.1 hypothetical protein GGS22DRAFT_189125 [Annulohypoxylon maeteangense]
MDLSQDQISASVAVEPYKQPLPPEVFIILLKNLPDYMMPYLWCNFRRVCKSWKAEIERIFREKCLPRTKVVINHPRTGGGGHLLFSRLSQDDAKLRAYFYTDPSDSLFITRAYPNIPEQPYTLYRPKDGTMSLVQMKDVAISDPVMEDFVADQKNHEVSFLWMPMMDQLMGDEIRFRREACKIVEAGRNLKEKPKANDTEPGSGTMSEITAQDDGAHATETVLEYTDKHDVGKITVVILTKAKTTATKLEPDAGFDVKRKKIEFYMLLRSPHFRGVINQVRESRLRKQYALCGDEFVSIRDHDEVPLHDDASKIMLDIRLRFRTPGYFMEL